MFISLVDRHNIIIDYILIQLKVIIELVYCFYDMYL